MRWTTHIGGGPMRVNHAGVCMGDKIFSFGGYCSTEEYNDRDPISVHVLDTCTFRWSLVNYHKDTMVPTQRYGHTTVPYKYGVYMWGGRNNTEASETLFCFDTRGLRWYTPKVWGSVPCAKDGHSACVIGNKMYIFGGFEYLSDQYSEEIHCLNMDTFEWSYVFTTGQPPTHRDFHTAVTVGTRMYVFGGRGDLTSPYNSDDEIYCAKVYYLDTVHRKWVTLTPQGYWPEGRRSHSAWVYNDFMYVFGGFNGNRKMHYNDLHRYSIKNNQWEVINAKGPVPCKRRRQVCLLNNHKVYLFGGTSPNPHGMMVRPQDDAEAYLEPLLDNNDLHVLDLSPSLRVLSIMAALENKIDISSLPREIIMDIRAMTLPNRISRPINQNG